MAAGSPWTSTSAGRGGSLGLLGADPTGGLWFRWSLWFGAGDALVHWDDGAWQVYDAAHGLPLGVGTVALAARGRGLGGRGGVRWSGWLTVRRCRLTP